MDNTEQYILVSGRDVIVSKNLQNVVQENDSNSEKVLITMNRFYDGEDFDTKQVNAVFKNHVNDEIIVNLNSIKTTKDSTLEFNFIFTAELTKFQGYLDFVIIATGSNGYKWHSKQATKQIFISSNFTYHEQPVPNEYYVDLGEYRKEILGYIEDCKKEVINAKSEVQNCKNEVVNAAGEVVEARSQADRSKLEADRAWAADFAKHVTVDTQTQSNIDFMGREMTCEGYLNLSSSVDTNVIQSNQFFFIFKLQYKSVNTNTTFLTNVINNSSGIRVYASSSNRLRVQYGKDLSYDDLGKTIDDGLHTLKIFKSGGNVVIDFDGVIYNVDSTRTIQNENNFKIATEGLNAQNVIKECLASNRPLAPQEIAHNFQVLNNSPSINAITTTDAQNVKNTLSLASDSEHVVHKNGHNTEEAYTGVLKTMAKDFAMDAQGKISVSNGLSCGKVLGLNVQGQTIKRVKYTNGWTGTDFLVVTYEKTNMQNYRIKNVTNKIVIVYIGDSTTGVYKSTVTISDNDSIVLGVNEFVLYAYGYLRDGWVGDVKNLDILKNNFIVITTSTPIISYIPFGLSSTQAIITNNNQSYPIYEPQILGKTEILRPTDSNLPGLGEGDVLDLATRVITFANKTTRQLSEVEVKSYYLHRKVITCGGVNGVYDSTVLSSDGSALVTKNTKEVTLTATTLTPTDIKANSPILASQSATIASGVITGAIGEVVRYQLATPTVTTIDKSLVPTIPTQQNIICSVDSAVAPSSFTASIPVTDGLKKEFVPTLLNGYVPVSGSFSPRVSSTNDGKVEISLDLTSPSTFNATVLMLDSSIRPKTNIRLNGYVDNISTPILVKSTGEVQLPNSVVSKNVYIKDTYRLV